jgi:hypothetical protein
MKPPKAELLNLFGAGPVDPAGRRALRRFGLWDKDMERPHDRVCALRLGVLTRAWAMHEALPMRLPAWRGEEWTYVPPLLKGREATTDEFRTLLLSWPEDWQRNAFGGSVPLDCMLIALVGQGFAPPATEADFRLLCGPMSLSSGGSVFDWPLVNR